MRWGLYASVNITSTLNVVRDYPGLGSGGCRFSSKSKTLLLLGNWLGFHYQAWFSPVEWDLSVVRELLVATKISVLLVHPWAYWAMVGVEVHKCHSKAGLSFEVCIVTLGTMEVSPWGIFQVSSSSGASGSCISSTFCLQQRRLTVHLWGQQGIAIPCNIWLALGQPWLTAQKRASHIYLLLGFSIRWKTLIVGIYYICLFYGKVYKILNGKSGEWKLRCERTEQTDMCVMWIIFNKWLVTVEYASDWGAYGQPPQNPFNQ